MIGVVGCGSMGLPMLTALRDAGAAVQGLDLADVSDPDVTSDSAAFWRKVKTALIVVGSPSEAATAIGAEDGPLRAGTPLERLVLCTTVTPADVRQIRALLPRGVAMLDAAIVGTPQLAADRALGFLVGGQADDVDDLTLIFSTMASRFRHMGPLGTGMEAKLMASVRSAYRLAADTLVQDWAAQSGLNGALCDPTFPEYDAAAGAAGRPETRVILQDVKLALDAMPDPRHRPLVAALQDALPKF